MLSGFQKVKQLSSSKEFKPSTKKQSKSKSNVAYTESSSDVITVCDHSHMTLQECYEFWMNLNYSANQQPGKKRKTIQE
jgi:hypothetical protein